VLAAVVMAGAAAKQLETFKVVMPDASQPLRARPREHG